MRRSKGGLWWESREADQDVFKASRHRAHLPRCNFDVLKGYASRWKVCPVAGCPVRLPRIANVIRDDDLRERLGELAPSVDVVWLHTSGGAVRTADPGAAASPRVARSRKRDRECVDLTTR